MAVYTVARFDFSASPAIITKTNNYLKTHTSAEITSGNTTSGLIPHWTKVVVDSSAAAEENAHSVPAEFPFTSGIYENRRVWTSIEAAQASVDAVNAWLNSNPDCKAFHKGLAVVQVDYDNTTKPPIVEAEIPTT